jgi:N-acetylneuraminate synthase
LPCPHPALLIAEAGVNHNGDLGMAFELIDAAADSGADLIKFQTFSAKAMVSKSAALAQYQEKSQGTGRTQYDMLLELEFDRDAHLNLLQRCQEKDIGFLSTPFDLVSLDMLLNDLGQTRLKIGSGDLTNGPLLYQAARSGADLILSTGMASLAQIELSLGLLALAYSGQSHDLGHPSRADMAEAWADPALRAHLADRVMLLHCVSNYPASAEATNLRSMATLAQAFGLPVGYSDHTLGGTAAIAATALGACCIEKHLTLDCTLPGPDHAASSEPDALRAIFQAVREAETMLGSPIKAMTPEERSTAIAAKKRLVAGAEIKAGTEITQTHLTTMRAQSGGDPMAYWEVLGCRADRDYSAGDPVDG